MLKLPRARALATLTRSIRLLLSFPAEQRDPERFYTGLATDTRALLDALSLDTTGTPLRGTSVLDVGGGPGYFTQAFGDCYYIAVEPGAGHGAGFVRADGQQLPFADSSFDVVYSSNVAEHIPQPWTMGEEMIRVARPGGLIVLSYTIWLGPFGGHETGLWQHYVGGAWARDRYERVHGRPPKNSFGSTLFAVSCAAGIRWAESVPGVKVSGLIPRYHPSWAWWLVKVPILREFLVSNLVIVLVKDS